MQALRPNNKIKVLQMPEGPMMIWLGAEILCGKTDFYDPDEERPKPFVKKKEWTEHGPSCIHRLCQS